MAPRLSIIIVSWNVCDDLAECLRSTFSGDVAGHDIQVIVVDNASTDNTIKMISTCFPAVQVIANPRNVGFAKANNQGLALAKGELVLFLNPDTIVMPSTLSTCADFVRKNASVGLMGCKILFPDGKIQYECARTFPTLRGMLCESMYLHMIFPWNPWFGRTRMSYWDHLDSRDVDCLVGAFMLGRRSVLNGVSGMDQSVFLGFEDIDLCYRIKKAGWRIFYLADVEIIHKMGLSRQKSRAPLVAIEGEARMAFFKKHRSQLSVIMCWLLLLWSGLFRTFVSLLLRPVVRLSPSTALRVGTAYKTKQHWTWVIWAISHSNIVLNHEQGGSTCRPK